MKPALVRLLLLLYPREWRARYAEEILSWPREAPFSVRDLADLARRGFIERRRRLPARGTAVPQPSYPLRDVMTQDIRFAFRMMRSHPWFSAAIVATLALGIGVNTTVFTLVNAVLFKPLPFRDGDRIVAVRNSNLSKGQDSIGVSYSDYLEYRAQATAFETLEATRGESGNLSEQGNPPEGFNMHRVTGGFFEMLGVQPALGRYLAAADVQPEAPPVLVIAYTVWRDRYDLSPAVIGHSVRLNRNPVTIVGVMPERFGFPNTQQLWAPLLATPELENRNNRFLNVIGVRKPGVSIDQAASDLDVVAQRLSAEFPDSNRDIGVRVLTFHELQNGGQIRTAFLLTLGAVAFVLLIACANVANMMLSRAIGRTREISIRAAMGASRWRIVRQLLVESVLLSFLGGLIGLALSRFGVTVFDLAVVENGKPSWILFTTDSAVFGYFAAICIASAVLFGLAPGLRASRVDVNEALKDGSRSVSNPRGILSGSLVVFQFMLAVVLLAGAGLFIRSSLARYAKVESLPMDRILIGRVSLPGERYPDDAARLRFYDQLLDSLRAAPGAPKAAIVSSAPAQGGGLVRFQQEGEPELAPTQRPAGLQIFASPGYFDLIGVPIVAGRDFEARDGAPGYEAAVVTNDFAARFWPNQSPLGKRFRVYRGGPESSTAGPWLTVVGVSGDVPQQLNEARPDAPFFLPYRPGVFGSMEVMVRPAADPASFASDLRAAVARLDPDLSLSTLATLAARVDRQSFILLRVFGTLFLVFAFAALLMASVGIYAVMAQATGRRTQEIGIRMALGANYSTILRLVLARGMMQLASGVVLGLAVAFGVTRLLSSLLGNVSPTDPLVFASVTLLLGSVGLLACWLPARRAAAMHPVRALRHE